MNDTQSDLERLAQMFPGRKYSQRLVPVDFIEGEEWREIAQTNNQYFISSLGRVKTEKLMKNGTYISALLRPVLLNGRPTIGLTLRPKYVVKTYISRLVLDAFKSQPDQDKKFVKHLDGNVSNCRLENLEWSSKYAASQSLEDAGTRGRKLKTKAYINKTGKTRYRKVQFSEKDYDQIRKYYAAGVSQIKIAEIFKTTQSFISQVVHHRVK